MLQQKERKRECDLKKKKKPYIAANTSLAPFIFKNNFWVIFFKLVKLTQRVPEKGCLCCFRICIWTISTGLFKGAQRAGVDEKLYSKSAVPSH